MADPGPLRQPGLGGVVLVGLGVVVVVLAAAALTGVLPPAVRALITDTPLAIAVLAIGTAVVLVRLVRRP